MCKYMSRSLAVGILKIRDAQSPCEYACSFSNKRSRKHHRKSRRDRAAVLTMAEFSLQILLLSWLSALMGPWQSLVSYLKRVVQQRIDRIMFPLKERDLIYQAYGQV